MWRDEGGAGGAQLRVTDGGQRHCLGVPGRDGGLATDLLQCAGQ